MGRIFYEGGMKGIVSLTLFVVIAVAGCGPESIPATPTAAPVATSTGVPPWLRVTPVGTTATAITPTVTSTPTRSSGGVSQPAGNSTPESASARSKPAPCNIDGGEEVYLVIEGRRRHILELLTFDNLGYTPGDIAPCGDKASLPEGAPFTRLLKGSGDKVYLVDLGLRRWIPDMTTLESMGFGTGDITTVPDTVLTAWPLGIPFDEAPAVSDGTLLSVLTRGEYTIRVWQPKPGHGLFNFATISHAGQEDVRINDVESIEDAPGGDVTGEGQTDMVFHIRSVGSAHCCWGTKVYNLGATPEPVLELVSPAYQLATTGQGEFHDTDGDGRAEFLTTDPVGIACSQPTVRAVLRYDPGLGRYVGATPQFAAVVSDGIDALSGSTPPGGVCEIYGLVAQLIYAGRSDEARSAFDRLYNGGDAAGDWSILSGAVIGGRFYVGK